MILAASAMLPGAAQAQGTAAPLIIAHRGASGERPEHTLAAYDRAIDAGADFVEPDLVVTADGVLVARHENEIGSTTDVADHPEFVARRTTKVIDGVELTGWFAEDFTLAELRTLRARERIPQLRPANARFDGLYQIPTLAEIIALVRAREAETGRTIGLVPEIKHPGFLLTQGHDIAALAAAELAGAGYSDADDAALIQCFEVGPIARLDGLTGLRLVQLVSASGAPADRPDRPYAAMLTPEGLAEVARHADVLGAELSLLLQPDGTPAPLVAAAHEAGLAVHGWTLRRENQFLPTALRRGDDPAAAGNLAALWAMLAAAGVDAVFTDNPAEALAARR
ncbi:glycerophosphodiester phosphodiesterase family protein [Croceibacterium ferulae]|uniref:glycerophosphodiester phosphodiesterase family protein n=1 Tax=Croceibacterium ferulae TaxID=1854641 RepID=UPI000EB51262|nr:glycerophosphodiester phosphodiesterase family protein [Croceibacterium ferulae]